MNDYLLSEVGEVEPYQAAMRDSKGKKIGHLVLDSLTKDEQKAGFEGQVYKKEKELFEKAMGDKYYNLMVCISYIYIV